MILIYNANTFRDVLIISEHIKWILTSLLAGLSLDHETNQDVLSPDKTFLFPRV